MVAALLSGVACEQAGPPASGAGASSAGTSAAVSRTGTASQRGEFTDGDERGTWILTTAPDGTFSIEDDVEFGEDGRANRLFRFDAAATLRFATEQRTITAQSGSSSPTTLRSELIVDFSVTPPTATKKVDDAPRTAASYEIDNLQRRAALLRSQAHR